MRVLQAIHAGLNISGRSYKLGYYYPLPALVSHSHHLPSIQLLRRVCHLPLEETEFLDLSGREIGVCPSAAVQWAPCAPLSPLPPSLSPSLPPSLPPVAIEKLAQCCRLQTLVLANNSIDVIRNVDCCRHLWKIDLTGNMVRTMATYSPAPNLNS